MTNLQDIKKIYIDKIANSSNFFAKFIKNTYLKRIAKRHYKYVYERSNFLKETIPGLNSSSLDLVGKNWLAAPDQPVAIMIGFNDWKLGFSADYVPEYRTAFLAIKTNTIRSLYILYKARRTASTLIIWGYKSRSILLPIFARRLGYKLARMEDGFIRSVELGANHSTPYSLVYDEKGLYFNARDPSTLEDILNEDKRLEEPLFLEQAQRRLDFIIAHGLSKYNQISAGGSYLARRRRDIVLVIGQVPYDAAVLNANPDNWTSSMLVALARQENPLDEVIYRPHPDVYNRPDRHRESLDKITQIATVISPTAPLQDILPSAKRVYTISSLVGMEALMRGIPVTTVGVPFYAGWGVTQDKCDQRYVAFARRRRRLTRLQLFAGAYLLYPRYIGALEDPELGLTAASLRILGERKIQKAPVKISLYDNRRQKIAEVARSPDWATLLRHDFLSQANDDEMSILVKNINFNLVFADKAARLRQMAISCRLIGLMKTWAGVDLLLHRLRGALLHETFSEILSILWRHGAHVSILQHFAWLLEESDQDGAAYDALKSATRLSREAMQTEAGEVAALAFSDRVFMSDAEAASLLSLAGFNFRTRRIEEAVEGALQLLLDNKLPDEALSLLLRIANLTFDFSSSTSLAEFSLECGLAASPSEALLRIVEDVRYLSPFDSTRFLEAAFGAVSVAPQTIADVLLLAEYESKANLPAEFKPALLAALDMDNQLTVEKARSWILVEKPERAIPILLALIERDGEKLPTLIALSQAYSYQGDYAKAKSVALDAVRKFEHVNAYREAMRLASMTGDIMWGEELFQAVTAKNLDVGEMSARKFLNGSRRIHEALLTQRQILPHNDIRKYYPERHTPPEEVEGAFTDQNVLFLSVYGPGDEIRTAQIYPKIAQDPSFSKFSVSCDRRLYGLMSRSFPDIDFVPVARVMRHGLLDDISAYTQLPAYDLRQLLDNEGHERALQADKIILAVDLLAKYFHGYEDFHGKKYLIPDETRSREFFDRLDRSKPIVGVNWRSSVLTHSRNHNYVSIQNLAPIFEMDGFQFVNLQYDDCEDELRWVEEHYPGKLINFKDLDQFNDFDGVAALISNLDLVVAAGTAVAELAGACGAPTWLLSNAAELTGRKIAPDNPRDIWHASMRHVEARILGDKSSLIQSLIEELSRFEKGLSDGVSS